MSYRNHETPVWEPMTLHDTTVQNYYGVLCLTEGNFKWKSEATGSTMTLAMTPGMTFKGRIVLAPTTDATGTYAGAKAI